MSLSKSLFKEVWTTTRCSLRKRENKTDPKNISQNNLKNSWVWQLIWTKVSSATFRAEEWFVFFFPSSLFFFFSWIIPERLLGLKGGFSAIAGAKTGSETGYTEFNCMHTHSSIHEARKILHTSLSRVERKPKLCPFFNFLQTVAECHSFLSIIVQCSGLIFSNRFHSWNQIQGGLHSVTALEIELHCFSQPRLSPARSHVTHIIHTDL